MNNANFKTLDAGLVAAGLQKAKRVSPSKYVACCPAHDDKTPSLSIADSSSGKLLVHCHAGCTQERVIDALRDLGLWHKPSRQGIEHRRQHNLNAKTQSAEMLLAQAVSENAQGIVHSKSERDQIKNAIRLIERHSDE